MLVKDHVFITLRQEKYWKENGSMKEETLRHHSGSMFTNPYFIDN